MNSMTGFGRGESSNENMRVTVELKSVNHRFLDIAFKLPKGFQSEEDGIRKAINKSVKRGHVDVFLSYEKKNVCENTILDIKTAENYLNYAKQLENSLGITNDITAFQLLKMPDVLTTAVEENLEQKTALVIEAANIAVENLVLMRKREGEALTKDLASKIADLEKYRSKILVLAPLVSQNYFEQLKIRVKELLQDVAVDEKRMLTEVAVFADKCAIDEELVRLDGHLKHFLQLLKNGNGKSLDFLVQEMGREVNTIGSKSNDIHITELVLKMKNEVEKIREQVQNLE